MSLEFIERYNLKPLVPAKNETKLDFVKKLTHLYMNGRFIETIVRFTFFLSKLFFKKIDSTGRLIRLFPFKSNLFA